MTLGNMTKELLDEMYKEHDALMKDIQKILWDDNQKDNHPLYYNSITHHFLYEHAWEILLPVPQEEWFTTLQNLGRYNAEMPWPQYATYQYCMDVILPPEIPASSLYFGYAILEDGSVKKTSFFGWMQMVEYQAMPQGIVMDPLAKIHNIPVKYYVGIEIDKEDIQNFILKRAPGHPLESYVERRSKKEHEERLHKSSMESYWLQMQYEPHYLPRALQEFAKKEGLPFPEDQRSTV